MKWTPSLHIDLWDDLSILNTYTKKTTGIFYVRGPCCHCSTPVGSETLLHKLMWNPGRTHWEGIGVNHPPQFESVKPFSLSNMSSTQCTK